MTEKIHKLHFYAAIVAIVTGAQLLLLTAFNPYIEKILTILPAMAWSLLVFCGFAGSFIFSVICLIKQRDLYAGLPLAVNLATILILNTVPLGLLVINQDFKINFERREKVAALIESGKLRSRENWAGASNEHIVLPRPYRYLSANGKVCAEKKEGPRRLFFYLESNGVLARDSGFVYVPDKGDLNYQEFLSFDEIVKLSDGWFYVRTSE